MSPRPGPRRPLIAVRIDADQLAALDEIAETVAAATADRVALGDPTKSRAMKLTRSDLIREAIAHYLREVEAS